MPECDATVYSREAVADEARPATTTVLFTFLATGPASLPVNVSSDEDSRRHQQQHHHPCRHLLMIQSGYKENTLTQQ